MKRNNSYPLHSFILIRCPEFILCPEVKMHCVKSYENQLFYGLSVRVLALPQLSMQTNDWRAGQFRISVHSWQYVASRTVGPGKFDVLKRTATQIVDGEESFCLA